MVFDSAGNVISAEGEPILIDSSVDEDAQIVARLDILEKPINKLKDKKTFMIKNIKLFKNDLYINMRRH